MKEVEGCLFVGKHGLFKVYCVFKVLCIKDVHNLKQGDIVEVSGVKATKDNRLAYQINGDYYYHHHFVLLGDVS